MLALQFGRAAGRRKEPALFAEWGGSPAVTLLRHRSNANETALARRHQVVEAATGVELPDAAAEEADPARADEAYEAAVGVLRELTRDQKEFPLVFDELCHYGFRRNLWGRRAFGIVLSLAIAAAAGALLLVELFRETPFSPWTTAVAFFFALITLALWLFMVTPEWVKEAGFAYAERLLASAERLPRRGAPATAGGSPTAS